jgi:hypothetical protein
VDCDHDELGQAAYLLLAVWVVAVMILMLNHPLYRFLEGYTFPNWLAEWLKTRNQRRLEPWLREIRTLHEVQSKSQAVVRLRPLS